MGLITKTVKVKWQSRNKNHFVDLEYKFTKIGDEFEVKVEDLPKGSRAKVEYICDNCKCELNDRYSNYNKIVKEDGKTYCKLCSYKLYGGKNISSSRLKNSKSFEQWCVENNKQDILDKWDYNLNNCKPSEICYSTNKKYWFKCSKHPKHKSEPKCISSLTRQISRNLCCNQCNSFAQWLLDNDLKIEDYWDYDKNIINPWEIQHGSTKMIWIKCQHKDYHESYEVSCNAFVQGNRCPYCRGLKVHPRDSLGQYIVDNFGEDFLWKVWSSDKNDKSPFEYAPHSNKKVWWKCLDNKHKEYLRNCNDSLELDLRCPQCIKEKTESLGEETVRLYLKSLGYTILHEHNCTIRPINPKTKHPLPYDNEIKELKLIIEVHGQQHYMSKNIWTEKDKTPEQQLHYQQVKDRYKRIYAIQNGYYYLEIPYTAFNKQETYKKLIDDKIKQIKNEKESA